jgi:hypothetical protein
VRLLVIASLVSLSLPMGCAQTVHVRAQPADADVTLNDVTLGSVGAAGRDVEVQPDVAPLRWELDDDGTKSRGEIARTEVEWLWVAAGIGAAAVCAPALALGGVCLANPAAVLAFVGCFVSVSPSVCLSVAASPGWLTVPLAGLGFAFGLSPLGLALAAQRVPDEIVLPPDRVEATRGASTGVDDEQAW